MVQYLLNATAIWLLSLIAFDLLLKRESYHGYNRFYLLFTFVLGAVLPLIQLQGGNNFYPQQLEKPIERVITAKRTVIESTSEGTTVDWEQWLLVIYLAGALVVIALLVAEIIKLVSYFYAGKRSSADDWTIIETGREHTPFSFLKTLFVTEKEQYNAEEWSVLLTHEKSHHHLFHFADVVLMQSARIVFWFHPLVYMYNMRLLLVHEYQADKTSALQPQHYGKFLVEQALLQSAPAISHSFNRSPIKKRILMLTHSSSSIAKSKMLVFVPLVATCSLFFSKSTFSQIQTGRHSLLVVPFGISDTAHTKQATYGQLLNNPTLTCTQEGCEVVDFTISFLPKGQDFIGPFTIKGSRIPQKQMELIRKLKDEKNKRTMVYLEDIHAKVEGTVRNMGTIVISCSSNPEFD